MDAEPPDPGTPNSRRSSASSRPPVDERPSAPPPSTSSKGSRETAFDAVQRNYTTRFRPPRHPRRRALLAIVVVVWLGVRILYDHHQAGQRVATLTHLTEAEYTVVNVVSPNEFLLTPAQPESSMDTSERGQTGQPPLARVRLLGVAAPWQWNRSPDRWRAETMAALADRVTGKDVQVQLTQRQIAEDGTLLAYLLIDGCPLSDFLVRQGWMCVDPAMDPSRSNIRRLYQAQDEARLAARGIWSGRALGMIDFPGT